MAYYQFDSDNPEPPTRVESVANTTIAWLVRFAGLALLVVGLWTAVTIILEAWTIYTNPKSQRVEAFARAIEDATHLDAVLTPKRTDTPVKGEGVAGNTGAETSKPATHAASSGEEFRFSYFVAWAILLMMMLLVGRLSLAAIKTGGELALYDVQIRRFARELMREVARERSRS